MGLLGGGNDMALLERTGVGRDINRHRYAAGEVHEALQRPVLQDLLSLIRLRNTHPAFQGEFRVGRTGEQVLALRWEAPAGYAELIADLRSGCWTIRHGEGGPARPLALSSCGPTWEGAPQQVEWCS